MTEITDLTKAVKELTRAIKAYAEPVTFSIDADAAVSDAPRCLVGHNNTTDGYLRPLPRLSSQAGLQSFVQPAVANWIKAPVTLDNSWPAAL